MEEGGKDSILEYFQVGEVNEKEMKALVIIIIIIIILPCSH